MKTIISEKFLRIIRNKKQLEKLLDIKITNRGKEISCEGNPQDEEIAVQVFDALEFGFPFSTATLIKTENKIFTTFNVKEYTSKKNLASIRARIIGKDGKAIRTLCNLSGCNMELKENEVGIIGEPEEIKNATEGLIQLVQGAKHGNVYSLLEKRQIQPIPDWGLKKGNKN
jgi:ribosomal RNA assembly protein